MSKRCELSNKKIGDTYPCNLPAISGWDRGSSRTVLTRGSPCASGEAPGGGVSVSDTTTLFFSDRFDTYMASSAAFTNASVIDACSG